MYAKCHITTFAGTVASERNQHCGGQGELSCSTAVLLWKTECNQLLAYLTLAYYWFQRWGSERPRYSRGSDAFAQATVTPVIATTGKRRHHAGRSIRNM